MSSILRNKKPSKSLLTKLLKSRDLSRVHAVAWGIDNEDTALKKFEEVTGLQVCQTGLWLHESGFLGASPDGLIGNDACLEIKCPYAIRNCSSVKEGLENAQSYFVYYDKKTAQWLINKQHNYYHQVQGQLHLTKRKLCHVMIWTVNDYYTCTIERDDSYKCNLDKLVGFHVQFLLPMLMQSLNIQM